MGGVDAIKNFIGWVSFVLWVILLIFQPVMERVGDAIRDSFFNINWFVLF